MASRSGLEVQELTPELKGAFRLAATRTGILVNDVISESPGERAGLKRGDVLTALEGMEVSSPSDYREVLAEFTPGDRLQLTFFRKGKEMAVRVQPEVFPLDLTLDLVDRRLGIKVGEIDTATQRRYGLEGGVSIEYVRRNSEAGRIGLQAGDLIFRVNKLPVMNMDEFKKAIRRYHYLSSLTLLVRRGPYGYSLTLPF